MAHQAYLTGDYGRCIGMAENALGMKQARYPISEMFLHLVAAMGWMSKRQPEKAECHFMEAWSIAQADDLIETIGEHHGLLQGLPEACLKKRLLARICTGNRNHLPIQPRMAACP